ncbi:MAG: patatin-like phospholipase family protein [Candidatus Kryptoniota bacterium]
MFRKVKKVKDRGRSFVLALGGGGARGLAHIGVLKELERGNFIPSAIAGTSMGAVVGAMYAYYQDAFEVEELFKKFFGSQFHEKFGKQFFLLSDESMLLEKPAKLAQRLGKGVMYLKAVSTGSVFKHRVLEETISFLVPDVTFEQLRIPFACVAANLLSGEEVIFRSGRLIPALVASSAIPGIVDPVNIDGMLLVDGSATSIVPVDAALQFERGEVVAVDVSMDLKCTNGFRGNAIEVAVRASELTNYYLNQTRLSKASVVIHPRLGRTSWSNFGHMDEIVSMGEKAAKKKIPEIAQLIAYGYK